MTMMEAAFGRAGVSRRAARLDLALAEFQNNGGRYEEALALLDAAYERGGAGHFVNADKAKQTILAAAPRNDSEGGHIANADKARLRLPPSLSPKGDGPGQRGHADKAIPSFPAPVSPDLPPSPVSIAALIAQRAAVAKTVLDSFKLRDGRAIGDVAFCELEHLRFDNAREAAVIRLIQKHAANAAGNALVREVIKAADLERFIQKGAEAADV